VAKTEGFSDEDVSIAEVGVVVEIAATETGRSNADLDFVCLWSGNFAGFLVLVSMRFSLERLEWSIRREGLWRRVGPRRGLWCRTC
jgi:hypothetical protein